MHRHKRTGILVPASAASGRPLFEANPQPRLVAALKEAFGHFTPSDRAWWRVEREMKEISHETNPAGHEEFCRRYMQLTSDDVIGFLIAHGLVEDRYQQAADSIGTIGRKIIVKMLENNATKQSDGVTRAEIEQLVGLTFCEVKVAIERDIKLASACLGTKIIEAKPNHGSWLTAAGVEVAKRVNQKIVKHYAPQNTGQTIRNT